MTKIVFPLEGLNNSGGVRIITQLCNYLSLNNFEVEVIVPDYSCNQYYKFEKSVKITIVKTSTRFYNKIIFWFKLFSLSTKRNNDITIATGFKTPIYIYISKLINNSNSRLIYLLQHFELSSQVLIINNSILKRAFNYIVCNIGYSLPFEKIAVSNWIKDKLNNKKICVIPNGIDNTVFKNLGYKNRPYNFGIIGSNKYIKGYHYLIEAFKSLPEQNVENIKLLILSNEDIEMPEGLNYKLIKPENDFDVVEFYNSIEYFVFGSLEEGFGLPPLEALFCGCKIISSDCGGVNTYLNVNNSLLFEPGNISQLRAIIIQILNNKSINIKDTNFHNFNNNEMLNKYKKFFLNEMDS